MDNKDKNKTQLKDDILALYIAGLSVRDIASRLGTSKSTVSRILTPIRNQSPSAISPSARRDRGSGRQTEGVSNIERRDVPLVRNTQSLSSEIKISSSASRSEDWGGVRKDGGVNSEGVSNIGEVAQSAEEGNNTIIDKTQSTILELIDQIHHCTAGETDIAKLATAADKLAGIAERIANVARLAQADNNQLGAFSIDFTNRHIIRHKKNN